MQTQRGFVSAAVLIAIVLGLIVVGGGAYYFIHQQAASQIALENLQANSLPNETSTTKNPVSNQPSNTQPSVTTPTSNIQLYSVSLAITEDGTNYLYMRADGVGFSSAKNFVTFTPQDPSILPAYNLRSIALPSYAQGTAINLTLNSSQFSYGACRTTGGMCQGSITGFPTGNYYVSVTNGDCTEANCESNKVLVTVTGISGDEVSFTSWTHVSAQEDNSFSMNVPPQYANVIRLHVISGFQGFPYQTPVLVTTSAGAVWKKWQNADAGCHSTLFTKDSGDSTARTLEVAVPICEGDNISDPSDAVMLKILNTVAKG